MPPIKVVKGVLAKDLAATKAKGVGKEFSRGIIFSRSRGKSALEDRDLLDKMGTLKDADFKKFADRLATLKGVKSGGGK